MFAESAGRNSRSHRTSSSETPGEEAWTLREAAPLIWIPPLGLGLTIENRFRHP